MAPLLNRSGATWCLLRHAPDAPAGNQDVDLLIERADRAVVSRSLQRDGFVPLVTPGRGRDRFFVRFDAAAGSWPKLDVVSRLSFGPHKEIVTDLAPGVLARRAGWSDGLWTPAVNDAFWLLLLHALLDKGEIRWDHRERLNLMRRVATPHAPPARLLAVSAVRGASAHDVLDHIDAGRWEHLERLAPQLLESLRRRQRVASWLRRQGRRAVRRAPAGVWPGRRLSVAVVSSDAVARSTLETALTSGSAIPSSRGTGRARDRLHAPPRGLVLASEASADVVLVVATAQPGPPAPGAGQRRVVLDAALPAAELARRAVAAVWSRYAALHTSDAQPPRRPR